jgi:large conductance mechanosensitive channel
MKSIVNEFRDFIARGNMIDLAVAVVVGAAFTQVVNAFAKNVLLQLIAAIFGTANFNDLSIKVNGTEIYYGTFLTAIVNLLIVAFAMFVVIKAINAMQNLRRGDEVEEEHELTEIDLLTEIRDSLRGRES